MEDRSDDKTIEKWVVLFKDEVGRVSGVIYSDMKQVAEHLNMNEMTFKRKIKGINRFKANGNLALKMPYNKSKRGS